MKWNKVEDCKPPSLEGWDYSDTVLVLRDCGEGSRPSYSVSSYRLLGWGGARNHDKWLDQESKGYRVVAWAELESPDDLLSKLKNEEN